ncbi:MAG: rod shape-determining protein RodA [Treponema sp. CETP13]|nr:MAG: rod shape-determining protein RodA [Treponema sp. CETP13]
MKLHILEKFDYLLVFCVSILIIFGIFCIYSSGVNFQGEVVSSEYIKQITFGVSGFIIMIIVTFLDFRRVKRFALYLYIAYLIILGYTFFFGRYVNGARSWLGIGNFGVQPSEFGKIIFILFLAMFLERSEKYRPFKRFLISFGILCLPAGLVLLQPDMGTASVYIPIFLAMVFVAGVAVKYIIYLIGTGIITILFTIIPIWQEKIFQKSLPIVTIFVNSKIRIILLTALLVVTIIGALGYYIYKNKYYYWITYIFSMITLSYFLSFLAGKVLQDYQIMRLIVFINPQIDPLGSGWNIIQSKIAIGSGSFLGQGYLLGTQSHYRFLPQQSTDFIFGILAEEFGFVGGLTVFILYFLIMIRILFIMKNTKNTFGYYIAAGILAMFFFHFVVNIGMVMGIMPITGIPLLFLSYGGSSLWTAMIAIGLLMSISSRQFEH